MSKDRLSGQENKAYVEQELRRIKEKIEHSKGTGDVRWELIYKNKIMRNISEVDRWSFDAFDGRVAEWIVGDLVDQVLPSDADRRPLLRKLESTPGKKIFTQNYVIGIAHAGNPTVYGRYIGRKQGDEITDIDTLHVLNGRVLLFDVDTASGPKGGGKGISRNWGKYRRDHLYAAVSEGLGVSQDSIHHAVVSWKNRFNPDSPDFQEFIDMGGVPVGLPYENKDALIEAIDSNLRGPLMGEEVN